VVKLEYQSEIVAETAIVANDRRRLVEWEELTNRVIALAPGSALKLTFPIRAAVSIARHGLRGYVRRHHLPIEISTAGLTLFLKKKRLESLRRTA
jgi:hypothetical protein